MTKPILKVDQLFKSYGTKKSLFSKEKTFGVPAIDHVSFELFPGETLGLIGESGSGKTSIGRAISKLMPFQSGTIQLFETDISELSERKFKHFRKDIQMIFQDLDAALNPNMKIRQIMKDILKLHYRRKEIDSVISSLLNSVKLDPEVLEKYPAELSGGQKRRIAIANILASKPKIILADEPTTGLDNYTQTVILKLIQNLQQENNIAMLLISHDLQVIKDTCQRVIVLYLGRIVESASIKDLSNNPAHPYTQLLWSSFEGGKPKTRLERESKHNIRSGLFDFERPLHGCRFAPRCQQYISRGKPEICRNKETTPELTTVSESQMVACHFPLTSSKSG